tara:strand:+ start:843 stop:1079 length:237 start_codon:yes stop_codon:yes gene_type:complete
MSKSKELRELIDKVKDDITVQVNTIVEWNLDESSVVQELHRQSKNNDKEFNELFQDCVNYIKVTSFEELFHEFTTKNK